MRTFCVAASLCFALYGASASAHPVHRDTPHWQEASGWPDRIITTPTQTPSTGFSVTWRTYRGVGRTIAQIVEATSDTRFDLRADAVEAETESINLEHMITSQGTAEALDNADLGTVHYHSVTFKKLKPDTLYAWRVQGERGKWSEWFQTRTAATSGPIKFVYFGDAQNGVRSHWSRVIRMAYQIASDAQFFLHAGDLVQKGDSDYNWAEWFDAGDFIHAVIPSIPVPGNHENIRVFKDDKKERARTPLWATQFTLPIDKDLPESYRENNYVIHYSDDLDIFVVDSATDSFKIQTNWLDTHLSKSKARWKVVTMHHPFFVPPELHSREGRDMERQKAFSPLIRKHKVDLVLTGHIHTYGRMTGLEDSSNHAARSVDGQRDNIQTVYVVSSSGAKNTEIWDLNPDKDSIGDQKPDYEYISFDRVAGNTPMFQVITLDGNNLDYAAHTATGEVYDAFRMHKEQDGRKRLIEGDAAFGDTRYFSNTGNYIDWWDLK